MGQPARLTVLGSGTAIPRPDRASSCYLLEVGDSSLMVDLGPGSLHRAAAAGCDLSRLDAVLITHIHPDHCADLVALQFALVSPELERNRPALAVRGHEDLLLLVARLRNAWPRWLAPGSSRLDLAAVGPGPLDLPGGLSGSAHAIAHHKSSLGYRLTLPGGAVVAFSGDATEGGDLARLAQDADLLVLEAAGPERAPVEGHLTPRRAAAIAARAQVRHLLLTHFYPATLAEPVQEQVREVFEGGLTLAHDGLVLTLPA